MSKSSSELQFEGSRSGTSLLSKGRAAREARLYGTMGCDPPLSLLESSFQAAAVRNASFVLYTGDFVRHGIRGMPDPEGNATAIVGEVSKRAKEIFEDTPLLFGALEPVAL